jgi:hypothetical protein
MFTSPTVADQKPKYWIGGSSHQHSSTANMSGWDLHDGDTTHRRDAGEGERELECSTCRLVNILLDLNVTYSTNTLALSLNGKLG